jgi:molecular chaperone GrpE
MNKKDIKQDIAKEQVEKQTVNETVEEISVEEKLQQDLSSEKDKFLRLFAEFENYRKRTARERLDLIETAGQSVMRSILPVLDDFERALGHIEEDKEAEDLRKGVMLIYQKLLTTLEQKGLKEMESKGKIFDSDFHQAITEIEVPNKKQKGKVYDVIEKGYFIGDKILRHAKVVVGK